MRHVIDATGTIPEDCADPMAFLESDIKAVRSRAERMIRNDRRWKVIPGAHGVVGVNLTIDPDSRGYRVECILDTEVGMVPTLPDEETP